MRRFLALLALGLASAQPAVAVEEPKFQTLATWDKCELRAYAALPVAETTVAASRDAAGYTGFRRLAGYIFGGNAKSEKIEMTAPVLETPDNGAWTIRFTMPEGHPLDALPKPNDADVKMRTAPPVHVGVIRFSGYATDADFADKSRELTACLAAHGLSPAGPAALAQYDPPWTLGPWRRNEVMIPVR
jgi:hypothetical protein